MKESMGYGRRLKYGKKSLLSRKYINLEYTINSNFAYSRIDSKSLS